MDAYAIMAKQSYASNKSNVGSFEYINSTSNDETSVYVDEQNKQVAIVSRGTALANPFGIKAVFGKAVRNAATDIFSDTLIATNLEALDPRVHRLKKIVKNILPYYKGYKVALVGHSLGGRLSMEVGRSLNIESHAFNPGSGPIDVLNNKAFGPSTHVYRTSRDFVSSFLPKEEITKTVKADKKYSEHSIEQFSERKAGK